MNNYSVIVAGGSHARFFTLEDASIPELESGPRLVELRDLINPENKAHQRTLWSSVKAGRNRAPGGGPAHGYDDHREQHEDEFERRFARDIAEEATRLVKSNNTQHVILVAQKRMLGFLRNALDPLLKAGVHVQECAKDLAKLPPQDLHAHLSRQRLLPPCRRYTSG
jgi:protein required for attachment to host cells